MKILFLCLKLQDSGLEILPTFSSYFQGLHLCLEMLEGEGLISILKIWV